MGLFNDTKRCSKCGEMKGRSEFHKDSRAKDGLLVHCKACRAAYMAEYGVKFNATPERRAYRAAYMATPKYREYDVTRRATPQHKERKSAYDAEYRTKPEVKARRDDPEARSRRNAYDAAHQHTVERKAKHAVRSAIESGLLARPAACQSCGQTCKPEAHHDSYASDRWLDVRFLCKKCHVKADIARRSLVN